MSKLFTTASVLRIPSPYKIDMQRRTSGFYLNFVYNKEVVYVNYVHIEKASHRANSDKKSRQDLNNFYIEIF